VRSLVLLHVSGERVERWIDLGVLVRFDNERASFTFENCIGGGLRGVNKRDHFQSRAEVMLESKGMIPRSERESEKLSEEFEESAISIPLTRFLLPAELSNASSALTMRR